MRTLILAISALGFFFCAGLLAMSFAAPVQVERWARQTIERQVQSKVETRWQNLDKPDLILAAEQKLRQQADEMAQARRVLVTLVVQEMQEPDCPCRRRLRELERSGWESRIENMGALNDRLRQLVQDKYAEVSTALLRELRVFATCNAAVFLLLGAVTFWRPRATLQLLAPAFVLLGAATVVAGVYLFSQDWLQTVLLSDYVGWTYAPWLGAAIAGLADVVWNRARVCTRLVNALLNVAGSAASAVPC